VSRREDETGAKLELAEICVKIGVVRTASSNDSPVSQHEISRQPAFVTTHWSVVLSARNSASPQSTASLEKLCVTYWYPLYAFARWRGYGPQDAEDLTQEFFLRLLQKNYLDSVERERGRFRIFLLVAFKRFLANEWDRGQTLKRGGGSSPIPIDTALAERLYRNEPPPALPAEALYERRWAVSMIQQAMARLRAEFEAGGKADEFERLKGFLAVGTASVPLAETASKLGRSEGTLRVEVHRLRKRFRQLFREEVSQTVAAEEDVEEEIRCLLAALKE
jgi:RNA polymerase sigma-70 factor (ECF subfamily)